MKKIILSNQTNPKILPLTLKYCDSFLSKFKGLMFINNLPPQEGIILVDSSESKINSSIHMFFMNFNITVLWLTKDLTICDKALAKKWRPAYFPAQAAKFVVEISENEYSNYAIGDILDIKNV
jgi:uncharacterized membrane protein (UPF0127 family)